MILGRRGPHQIMMTPKELGELGELERAAPHVAPADLPAPEEDAILEPGLRKSVSHLRAFAATPEHIRAEKPIALEFVFMSSPKALIGNDKVEAIEVEKTRLVHGRAEGTGETETIPRRPRGQLHRLPHLADPGRAVRRARRPLRQRRGPHPARPLLRRLGPPRAFGHDRHQPPRRLRAWSS